MTTRQHYQTGSDFDALIDKDVVNTKLENEILAKSLDQETRWDTFIQLLNVTCSHRVIEYAKGTFDDAFPLQEGSHHKACAYLVYYEHLLITFADGSMTGLRNPHQLIASHGSKSEPCSIVLEHLGSHIEICFDPNGELGQNDLANINNLRSIGGNSTLTSKTQEAARFINLQSRGIS